MKLNRALIVYTAALTIAVIFGTGCRGSALSKRDEIQIGREGSRQIESVYKLDPDPRNQALVQEIGQRLVVANNLKAYPYTFKVLDSSEINAVSLPGGPIYVFKGLVEMANRDELAGVIAHELGHVDNRHVAKQYTKGLWMSLAASVATGGRGNDVANVALALQQLSFSRHDEYQSDDVAVEYTYKAGFDPNGISTFFQKLQAKEKGNEANFVQNLRTHPLNKNRIARANERIRKVTGAPPPGSNP